MKLNIVQAAVAAMTVITLAAPASAQNDRGRYRSPGSGERSGENRGRPADRPQAQAREERRDTQPRREVPRQARPSVEQPRAVEAPRTAPRAQAVTPVAPRPNANPTVAPRVQGYAVPRGSVPPPAYNNNAQHYDNHSYNGHYDNHGYRPYYAPRYYGHPAYRPYAFRPHFHLAFGVYVGYPVTYTYAYPYPIPVYGYGAPSAPVVVQPNSPYYGGIALEITPSEGLVYVDGNYVGSVQDFDGTNQPLTLTAGTHRIQITAPGYETLVFDAQVQPGQVIPYQGAMQAY